jgi:hypothetical protein
VVARTGRNKGIVLLSVVGKVDVEVIPLAVNQFCLVSTGLRSNITKDERPKVFDSGKVAVTVTSSAAW